MKKKWIYLLSFIILVAGFVAIQWDSWFYNPPELSYRPSSEPGRVLLSLVDPSPSTRVVTWQCDTTWKYAFVQYVNANGGDTITSHAGRIEVTTDGGSAAYFRAIMSGLKPGTPLQYRVGRDHCWSKWYHSVIPKQDRKCFSFVYFGDIQDTVGGVSSGLFDKAYRSIPEADFWAFGGDLIERPLDRYWKQWFDSGEDIFATVPVIATPGNHEYRKAVVKTIASRWTAHFPFPNNGPKNFKGSVCYWDYMNTRIISIDSGGLQGLFSYRRQMKWLKKVMTESRQQWNIVLMHHPIYSTSPGRNNLFMRLFFKPIFEKYRVDLVLQGHDHAYGRAAYIKNATYKGEQGPVYVVTHGSPKSYSVRLNNKMDRVAFDTQMYQVINISADSLNFNAYTREGKYYDGFTLVKTGKKVSKIVDYNPEKLEGISH